MNSGVPSLARTIVDRVERPPAAAHRNQEKQRAEHRKISAGIADHVPEALPGAKQFGELRGSDRRADYNQQRNGCHSGPKSEQNEDAAHNLRGSHKVRCEIWMRKSNPREPCHTHIRIGVLQNSLRKENQPNRQADQQDASRTLRRCEKETKQRLHIALNLSQDGVTCMRLVAQTLRWSRDSLAKDTTMGKSSGSDNS